MIFKFMLSFIFFISVSGCVSAPSRQQLAEADYGTYPENWQSIVQEYMSRRLKDPASATYAFRAMPSKMWAGGGLSGPIQFGWGFCTAINAKNSFGGYTGERNYFFLIKNSSVLSAQDSPVFTEKLCDI